MIGLEKASVRFGARVLFRNLTFAVPAGRTLAILGPNGRGKTTALRAVLGFTLLAEGRRFAPLVIGYVPQSTASVHAYRTIDAVVLGRASRLGLFGQPKREDRLAAAHALETVGATHLSDKRVDQLSGGERQLVLIARALVTGAAAMLLDEPGSALDLRNQARLLTLLRSLGNEEARAILFTTHDPNHALAAADDALLLMPEGDALFGCVDEVLTSANLERLFGVPMLSVPAIHAARGRAVVPVFG